ncbi:MAG: hypothetical protein L3J83_10155 [Proteobacteria bacterium]|nr:hypothetical protein [Pseudomonadota bacterium]
MLTNQTFSEDCVRYSFFISLVEETNIESHEILMEYPHPLIENAKIDTFIPSNKNAKGLAIEFKYDRRIPSGKNAPKPQKAGKLFKDINRLLKFGGEDKVNLWLIYLTDDEMIKYYRNTQNKLNDFFNLSAGENIDFTNMFLNNKSETFKKNVGYEIKANVQCLFSKNLLTSHELRVYQVRPITDKEHFKGEINIKAEDALIEGFVPKPEDFKKALKEILKNSIACGKDYIDVRAGDLHIEVGGYGEGHSNHRMPTCCDVMYALMNENDEIIYAPPKKRGANLTIRYFMWNLTVFEV